MNRNELLEQRRARIAASLSLAYDEPLDIVRGEGPYLIDARGQRYLDLVNNVCHVGHCHPRVVQAATEQMGRLNTNTRYLHENLVRYAERLAATLPDPLEVCFFVNSGSEANDLALRLCRTATKAWDAIVLGGAYHGHTQALIELSPYKYAGPGGPGRAPHVWEAPLPDAYRGPHRGDDAGALYALEIDKLVTAIQANHRRPAVFFAESILGCGGQVEPPAGFLERAYASVRAAEGLCIADEVQTGFGRVGSHFWAFERHGVVPDVVTLGKPIGNGHPLAAVVTTRAIADAFANGMEYFNTFGGNPVSCAIGLAVLDVIEEEALQAHAQELGRQFRAGLERLAAQHALIGDVRGAGLFLGLELVRDRATLEPAADEARALTEQAKRHGVLLSTDGPFHNVIKIKPPLAIGSSDVERALEVIDAALAVV